MLKQPRIAQAAQRLQHAPWLVANLQLRAPLADRPGAPPSWDNVVYGSAGLGYVDAMHQSLQVVPGATVLRMTSVCWLSFLAISAPIWPTTASNAVRSGM